MSNMPVHTVPDLVVETLKFIGVGAGAIASKEIIAAAITAYTERKNNKDNLAYQVKVDDEGKLVLSQESLNNFAIGILAVDADRMKGYADSISRLEGQVGANREEHRNEIEGIRAELDEARTAHQNCEKDREIQRRRIDSLEAMQIGAVVATQHFAEEVTKPAFDTPKESP